jgi:hypothetical protein
MVVPLTIPPTELILNFIQDLVVVKEGIEGGRGNGFPKRRIENLEDSQCDNQD